MAQVRAVRHPWRTFRGARPSRLQGDMVSTASDGSTSMDLRLRGDGDAAGMSSAAKSRPSPSRFALSLSRFAGEGCGPELATFAWRDGVGRAPIEVMQGWQEGAGRGIASSRPRMAGAPVRTGCPAGGRAIHRTATSFAQRTEARKKSPNGTAKGWAHTRRFAPALPTSKEEWDAGRSHLGVGRVGPTYGTDRRPWIPPSRR